jgi:hypothetical protein
VIASYMCADLSFGQWEYLDRSSQRVFGLEAMAIIFSLPWALLLWSYVISLLKLLLSPHLRNISARDRMVTFSVALLLFCFVVSNLWTQLFVALTSFLLFTFTLWCIWICWDFSSDGITVPARLKFLLDFVESLRIRTPTPVPPTSLASDDGSNRHSPSGAQGDVSV